MANDLIIRRAFTADKVGLFEVGFLPVTSDECPVCTETDDIQGLHDHILVKQTGSGISEVVIIGDEALSPFDVLLFMEFTGAHPLGAGNPLISRIVELAHRHFVDPEGVKLYEETGGLTLQWFLFMQGRDLTDVQAVYDDGAELWRKCFANEVPDHEFMACVATDEDWLNAIESVEIRQISDHVVFMSSPTEGMRNWYRLLLRPQEALPVVVVHNPKTGLVYVQAESVMHAVFLFGIRGLKAAQARLGDGWSARIDRLARTETGEATDAVTAEAAFEVASIIAGAVIGG